MHRVAGRLSALLMLAVAAWSSARATELPVDLELVLAVDVSGSVDAEEARQQREGYVAALADRAVIDAIGSNFHRRIAVAYLEWASGDYQRLVLDWALIDGAASAEDFAARLAAAPRRSARWTSISAAIDTAVPLFDGNGYAGERLVIDVSGDGPNNMGIPVEVAREPVIRSGVTINGLPIMIKAPGGFASIPNLDVYYEDCVIGGPGAFLIVVRSAAEFAIAIRRKLVLEIVGAEPRIVPVAETVQQRHIDCLIGEKLREQWMRE